MKRRVGELQVFSASFLDVLSNALGAILLLLLFSMYMSRQASEAASRESQQLSQQVASAEDAVASAQDALQEAQSEQQTTQSQLDELQQKLAEARSSLVGLKGDFHGVVFICDTSGSMVIKDQSVPEDQIEYDYDRWNAYRNLLKDWITGLAFDRFNVIRFSSTVEPLWPGQLQISSDEFRQQATQFVDRWEAIDGTNTMQALQTAFAMEGVDTIVLLSDGAPTLFIGGQPVEQYDVRDVMRDIKDWVRQHNADGRIKVNTVAVGNYFQEEYGTFLRELAEENGGRFVGF